jgi:hypothetical protein
MLAAISHLVLFAVRRQDLGGGFRGENNDYDIAEMVIVVSVLAVVISLLYLVDRWIRRRNRIKMYESPTELFRQLCRVHELGRSESQQLKQIAAYWKLVHPGALFVEPDYFRPDKLPADWYERVPQIELLHRKLFEVL